nr:hypothetical protein [Bacteroides sp.]
MTMRLFVTLTALLSLTAASGRSLVDMQLDSLKSSHKIVYLNGSPGQRDTMQAYSDSIKTLINNFYYDQFRHFQDPAAPYFLFMSKDAKLAMGIGGCVRMRGWYDWGGAIPANGFTPYLIQMTPDPTNKRHLGTTPAGTSIFYRVIGRDKRWGNYQLYIEANFDGYNGVGFKLKKSYGIINDWTIGYANSTFSDPAAVPPTVDASGPNNKVSPTNVLVRWMHGFRHGITVAASLETPSTAISATPDVTKKVSEWLPDVAAFVQYGWNESEHIRLAGILRTLSYRDLPAATNHTKLGWGLQISSVWHPLPAWTTYLSLNGGQGYESLGGDLQVGAYDLVSTPGKEGEMYAPGAIGWNVGVQYNITPAMFVSANYSQSRYLPRSGSAPDEYKYGQVIAVNYFWNLTARIQTGVELDLGMRKNMSGATKWAHRAGLMAQFSF